MKVEEEIFEMRLCQFPKYLADPFSLGEDDNYPPLIIDPSLVQLVEFGSIWFNWFSVVQFL